MTSTDAISFAGPDDNGTLFCYLSARTPNKPICRHFQVFSHNTQLPLRCTRTKPLADNFQGLELSRISALFFACALEDV